MGMSGRYNHSKQTEKQPNTAECRHSKAPYFKQSLNWRCHHFGLLGPKRGKSVVSHHLQLDDVRVSEEFEILDLPLDLPDDIEAADLLPVKDLDSDLVTRQLMFAD